MRTSKGTLSKMHRGEPLRFLPNFLGQIWGYTFLHFYYQYFEKNGMVHFYPSCASVDYLHLSTIIFFIEVKGVFSAVSFWTGINRQRKIAQGLLNDVITLFLNQNLRKKARTCFRIQLKSHSLGIVIWLKIFISTYFCPA